MLVAVGLAIAALAKLALEAFRWSRREFARQWSGLAPVDQRRVAEVLSAATLLLFGSTVLLAARTASVSNAHADEVAAIEGRVQAHQSVADRCAQTERAASVKAATLETQLSTLQAEHDGAERRAANVSRYAATSLDSRLKEAARVCTAEGQCDDSALGELLDSAKGKPDLAVLAAGIARISVRHDDGVRAARQREIAREANERAADKRREAREQEASRGLHCCDGSQSPSCRCHAPSHQGCCSHHGGVCGCEP